ncbi:WXG100 family type VII secretion target [Mycobacterium syngnathidarum]
MANVAGAGGGQELRVETTALDSASDQLQSIADELQDELRRLVSNTERVVEGTWRGEAATAFAREWEEFRSAAESVVEDADVIARLVELSATHYADTDETSAHMLRATWSRDM